VSKSVEDKSIPLLVQLIDDWLYEYATHYFVVQNSNSIICKCSNVDWAMGWIEDRDMACYLHTREWNDEYTNLETKPGPRAVYAASPTFFEDMIDAMNDYHKFRKENGRRHS
jgi:hypothetical protein